MAGGGGEGGGVSTPPIEQVQKREFGLVGDGLPSSPFDQFGWYLQPGIVETTLVAGGSAIVVANRKINRVGLLFSVSTAVGWISTDPNFGPGASVAAQFGFPINSSNLPYLIQWPSFGNLAQLEWRGCVPTGGAPTLVMTTMEILLKDWPKAPLGVQNEILKDRIRQQPNGDSPLVQPIEQTRGDSFWDSGWWKRYALERR